MRWCLAGKRDLQLLHDGPVQMPSCNFSAISIPYLGAFRRHQGFDGLLANRDPWASRESPCLPSCVPAV